MSYVPQTGAVPVLSYAAPVVPQRPAFNARRTWPWKGEHLFRVYLTPTHAWFIRIGGAKNQQAMYQAQFGLLGALIGYFVQKNARKKEAKRVIENEDKPLELLLPEHKRNHVIPFADVTDAAIEATGFWGGRKVKWTFNLPGQRKRVACFFDTADEVSAALQTLPPLLPALRVAVQYNEAKKRYEKVKA